MTAFNLPVQLYIYNESNYKLYEHQTNEVHDCHFKPTEQKDSIFWLNFHTMTDDLSIVRLCEDLKIEKVVQDDLFKGTRRPRLEEFHNYVFFSIESALPTNKNFSLEKERISFILGENYLISFQEKKSDHFPSVRERIEQKKGRLRSQSADFLLFRLLESIIDNYEEVLDDISDRSVVLDEMVINQTKSDVLRLIEWQKRKLVDLRKTALPMRELISQLELVEHPVFLNSNKHYYKELKDSCLAVLEELDAQKQILDGIANLYYAVQGQKMNEIMKVLTVTSAVFIPLTFIVGVYGMNFDEMPELHWKYGYYTIMIVMFILAVILVFIFYKRGWLKRN